MCAQGEESERKTVGEARESVRGEANHGKRRKRRERWERRRESARERERERERGEEEVPVRESREDASSDAGGIREVRGDGLGPHPVTLLRSALSTRAGSIPFATGEPKTTRRSTERAVTPAAD